MLSESQCEQFKEQGYLAVEGVIDSKLLDAVEMEYATYCPASLSL